MRRASSGVRSPNPSSMRSEPAPSTVGPPKKGFCDGSLTPLWMCLFVVWSPQPLGAGGGGASAVQKGGTTLPSRKCVSDFRFGDGGRGGAGGGGATSRTTHQRRPPSPRRRARRPTCETGAFAAARGSLGPHHRQRAPPRAHMSGPWAASPLWVVGGRTDPEKLWSSRRGDPPRATTLIHHPSPAAARPALERFPGRPHYNRHRTPALRSRPPRLPSTRPRPARGALAFPHPHHLNPTISGSRVYHRLEAAPLYIKHPRTVRPNQRPDKPRQTRLHATRRGRSRPIVHTRRPTAS